MLFQFYFSVIRQFLFKLKLHILISTEPRTLELSEPGKVRVKIVIPSDTNCELKIRNGLKKQTHLLGTICEPKIAKFKVWSLFQATRKHRCLFNLSFCENRNRHNAFCRILVDSNYGHTDDKVRRMLHHLKSAFRIYFLFEFSCFTHI